MILKTLVVGALHSNCYIVACARTRSAMVIDPGGDTEDIVLALDALDLQVRFLALTHSHFDHVLAAPALRERTGAPLCVHGAEAQDLREPPALFRYYAPQMPTGIEADRLLTDGDLLPLGELSIEVIHTPGHSPGGLSLYLESERVLFSGDALFHEGVGRTDFPGGDTDTLSETIRNRLYALPDDVTVYPGHGPATTIGHERQHNPFVRLER